MNSSLHKIKNLNSIISEAFHNPFSDDVEKHSSKKISHIADNSGVLNTKKDTFSISKIECTKTRTGEYTITSKSKFIKGEIIEMCPVMILGIEAKSIVKLKDILFEITKDEEYALVFGYGSIYKHSNEPNVEYAFNRRNKKMYFMAKKPIAVGDELTINYGVSYWQERNATMVISNESGADQPDVNIQAPGPAGKLNQVISTFPIPGEGQQ